MRLIYQLVNLFKFVFESLAARLQPKVISLNWGSHREEYSLGRHIREYLLEPSPNIVLTVKDQIVVGLTHRHAFSDRATYRLRDATFDPNTGAVYVATKLVLESHSDGPVSGLRRSFKTRNFLDRPLVGVPFQTHYHWLIETLPRVIAATRYEPNALLVASTRLNACQREAIEQLGHEVIFTDDYCQSDNLILATRGRDSGWAHPSDLDMLRGVFGVPSRAGNNNIFISRISSRRCDDVSIAMHECAVNTGWSVVLAEELTFTEHLRLFSQARVILGEHGAGLANIALAPTKTRLIEFVNTSCSNPCFNALSLVLNNSNDYYSARSRADFEAVFTSSRQII